MATDLTPAEKDDRQTERLINKRPAPSRKNRPKRGPKHDNRRRRMDTADPDVEASKRDIRSSLADIALRLVFAADQPDPESLVDAYAEKLAERSSAISEDFKKWAAKAYQGADPEKAATEMKERLKRLDREKTPSFDGPAKKLTGEIAKAWPSGKERSWAERAKVLDGLLDAMRDSDLPGAFKAPFLGDPKRLRKNPEVMKQLIADRNVLRKGKFSDDDIMDFAGLAGMFRILVKNPNSVTPAGLEGEFQENALEVYNQASQVVALGEMMDEWEKAIKEQLKREAVPTERFYDQFDKDMDKFFGHTGDNDSVVDPSTFTRAFLDDLEKQTGEKIPKEVADGLAGRARAASNGSALGRYMDPKIAAYHGVVQQGHPSGPTNTGYRSYDKRYFGKEQYDAIVASAKELLKTDWLSDGWDGGAVDAPVRAALDLAIQTAADGLFQSKIDAETYNMLLARLTGSDTDLFSETLVTSENKRSASAMDKNLQSMVKVANDIRQSNPRAAFEIMRNVRALRIAQVPVESQIQHVVSQEGEPAAPPPPAPAGGGEQTSAPVNKGLNVEEVKKQLEIFDQSRNAEQLMNVLQKLAESVKIAGSRTAGLMDELAPIADMSDEDIVKLVQNSKRDVTKLEDVLKKMDAQNDFDSISDEDVESLVKGIDDLLNGVVGESAKVQTASVMITASALLRIASISPEAKSAVLPYLAAAKKKMDKKKGKKPSKKAPAKKAEPAKKAPAKGGKPPFGGKKAPPFGGKKAPPFGKKKASQDVDLTAEDLSW